MLWFYLLGNGIVMIRREGLSRVSLLTIVGSLCAALLIALLGVAVQTGTGWLIAVAVALVGVSGYLGFLLVSFLAYGYWYGRRPPRADTDAVLVLGSRVFGDRVPPLLAARIEHGVNILTARLGSGAEPVLVCSGGQGADETTAEGVAMARYAIDAGAPSRLVLVEDASRNTEENLKLSLQLLRERGHGTNLVVVTNDYHVFRTAIIAHEVGIEAQVVGAPTARYSFPSAVAREFIGVLARTPIPHLVMCVVIFAVLLGSVFLRLG